MIIDTCTGLCVRFIQRNATCWPLHFMWWASDLDSGVSWWAGPGETKAPCAAGHNTGNLEMPWVSCELAPIISHSPIPRSELLLNPLSRVVLCNADSVIMLLHYRPVHDQPMHMMWMNPWISWMVTIRKDTEPLLYSWVTQRQLEYFKYFSYLRMKLQLQPIMIDNKNRTANDKSWLPVLT